MPSILIALRFMGNAKKWLVNFHNAPKGPTYSRACCKKEFSVNWELASSVKTVFACAFFQGSSRFDTSNTMPSLWHFPRWHFSSCVAYADWWMKNRVKEWIRELLPTCPNFSSIKIYQMDRLCQLLDPRLIKAWNKWPFEQEFKVDSLHRLINTCILRP